MGALAAVTTACVLLSQSGTSAVALLVLIVVLGLATLSLRMTGIFLAAGFSIATIFAVPLASVPYALGWHHWTWLPPESVAARFYIWKYTADKVYEHPITGIGIRGMRSLQMTIPDDAGHQVVLGRRVPHPHNVFIQIWLELGAVGAALFLGVGLAALWQIRRWPKMLEGAGYSLFATCCAVGSLGFDLWQTWLIASLALAWAAMLLATRLPIFCPATAESEGHRP